MADAHLAYKRAQFATRLPTDRAFTAGHFWIGPSDPDHPRRYRVGFTRFATRMLGEIVEFDFEVRPGDPVAVGQAIGWFEGFKAVSELYCPLPGAFARHNPDLDQRVEAVHKKPYEQGWLYEVDGDLPTDALDAAGYARFLDATIDRMMGTGA